MTACLQSGFPSRTTFDKKMTQFYWGRTCSAVCKVSRSLDKHMGNKVKQVEKREPKPHTFWQVHGDTFFIGRMAQGCSRVKKRNQKSWISTWGSIYHFPKERLPHHHWKANLEGTFLAGGKLQHFSKERQKEKENKDVKTTGCHKKEEKEGLDYLPS